MANLPSVHGDVTTIGLDNRAGTSVNGKESLAHRPSVRPLLFIEAAFNINQKCGARLVMMHESSNCLVYEQSQNTTHESQLPAAPPTTDGRTDGRARLNCHCTRIQEYMQTLT